MADIIITLFATVGGPMIVLMSLAQNSKLPVDKAIIVALKAIGQGNIQAGIICLIFTQLLIVFLTMDTIRMYYKWTFKKTCNSADETIETLEKVKALPVSRFMKKRVSDDVIRLFMHNIQTHAKNRKKQAGI